MAEEHSEQHPLDRLAEEFVARFRRGERPAVSEYIHRYPELADQVGEVLQALILMEELSPGRAKETTAGPVPFDEPTSPLAEDLRQLGDFRILREVGRGGMGVVYEAEQLSLRRRIALKVLPFAAALDARHLQRFQNEAHAAAHLHHQNIVPVYAVGSERSVHYYAMQFIEGLTLAAFIQDLRQQQKPDKEIGRPANQQTRPADLATATPAADQGDESSSLSANLAVSLPGFFRTAADLAVQAAQVLDHAHQLGVVHRDIKPANLLLDARGHLWVTDFGLAMVQGDTRLSLTGDLLGTLRYMSPEQALAKPGAVDHRTDVYALGATLYELLTLRPAFDGRDRQELLRQIAFEEPAPPRRISKAIPIDLETIVLRAMAKAREERYATAQELADDLRRFLENRPVQARRPTLVQRLHKWARRHPGVVLTGGISLVLLLATAVVALAVGITAVNREKKRTEEALQAESQALAAESKARKRTREALDEMSSQVIEDWLRRRAQLEPAQRAFLDKALAYYEAFAAESGNSEEVRLSVADAHRRIGYIRYRLEQHKEGEAALRRALELFASLAADFPAAPLYRLKLATTHGGLANLLQKTGRTKEAEAAYREALAIQKPLVADFPTVPEYRLGLASNHNNLGILLQMTGHAPEAEAAYREALAFYKALAADFPSKPHYRQELASSYINLGNLLQTTGHAQQAEAAFRDAVAIDKALTGDFPAVPGYRLALAGGYLNLGLLLKDTSRPKEAAAALRDALAIYKQLAADFPSVPGYRYELAQNHHSLGQLLAETGPAQEAERAFRDALDILKALTADFPTVSDYQAQLANTLNALAELAQGRKDYTSARQLLEQAWPPLQKALDANPRNPAYRGFFCENRQLLAAMLLDLGDHAAAAQAAAESVRSAADAANDAYKAACFFARCIPLAEQDKKLSEAKRKELANSYATQAIEALRQALAGGYKDITHLQKDKELDPLRSRDDFKNLRAEPGGP